MKAPQSAIGFDMYSGAGPSGCDPGGAEARRGASATSRVVLGQKYRQQPADPGHPRLFGLAGEGR